MHVNTLKIHSMYYNLKEKSYQGMLFLWYLFNPLIIFLLHSQLNMTKPCHCYGVLLFIGICNKTNTFYFIFLTLLYPFPVNKKNISFSIVRKYLVAFWWSVKKKKTHLGIHSFSPTCLVLLFTCLVGFLLL